MSLNMERPPVRWIAQGGLLSHQRWIARELPITSDPVLGSGGSEATPVGDGQQQAADQQGQGGLTVEERHRSVIRLDTRADPLAHHAALGDDRVHDLDDRRLPVRGGRGDVGLVGGVRVVRRGDVGLVALALVNVPVLVPVEPGEPLGAHLERRLVDALVDLRSRRRELGDDHELGGVVEVGVTELVLPALAGVQLVRLQQEAVDGVLDAVLCHEDAVRVLALEGDGQLVVAEVLAEDESCAVVTVRGERAVAELLLGLDGLALTLVDRTVAVRVLVDGVHGALDRRLRVAVGARLLVARDVRALVVRRRRDLVALDLEDLGLGLLVAVLVVEGGLVVPVGHVGAVLVVEVGGGVEAVLVGGAERDGGDHVTRGLTLTDDLDHAGLAVVEAEALEVGHADLRVVALGARGGSLFVDLERAVVAGGVVTAVIGLGHRHLEGGFGTVAASDGTGVGTGLVDHECDGAAGAVLDGVGRSGRAVDRDLVGDGLVGLVVSVVHRDGHVRTVHRDTRRWAGGCRVRLLDDRATGVVARAGLIDALVDVVLGAVAIGVPLGSGAAVGVGGLAGGSAEALVGVVEVGDAVVVVVVPRALAPFGTVDAGVGGELDRLVRPGERRQQREAAGVAVGEVVGDDRELAPRCGDLVLDGSIVTDELHRHLTVTAVDALNDQGDREAVWCFVVGELEVRRVGRGAGGCCRRETDDHQEQRGEDRQDALERETGHFCPFLPEGIDG